MMTKKYIKNEQYHDKYTDKVRTSEIDHSAIERYQHAINQADWYQKRCSFCGDDQIGHAYINISVFNFGEKIMTEAEQINNESPYRETIYCHKCFNDFGPEKAMEYAIKNGGRNAKQS